MNQHARSQWIGHPLRRLEDDALLCGCRRFADDFDAPAPLGMRTLDMPLTSEKIWRAINRAGV
jgi:hypothetical protein